MPSVSRQASSTSTASGSSSRKGEEHEAAGDHERASLLLSEALSLWRGSPLADFTYEAFASSEITRLEELRLSAQSEWVDAELGLGRHAALIAELEALVARQPLQERLRGQLMLALYRSGRQAEALEVYRDARRLLVEELGIEPGQALQRLEQSILTHDPALEPPRVRATAPRQSAVRAVVRDRRALTAVLAAAIVVGAAAAVLYVWTDRPGATPTVNGNAVAIIDPHSNRVTGQVAVGAVPDAVALGHGSLWVANTVDQTVSRIDLASGQVVRAIEVGGVPLSIAVGKNAVWVVRRRADGYPELIAIDPRFDVVGQAPRRIPGDPLSEASVVAGPDGLWVAAEAGSLQHLDPAGSRVTASDRHGQQRHEPRRRRRRCLGQRRERRQRRPHRSGRQARGRDDSGRTRVGRGRLRRRGALGGRPPRRRGRSHRPGDELRHDHDPGRPRADGRRCGLRQRLGGEQP